MTVVEPNAAPAGSLPGETGTPAPSIEPNVVAPSAGDPGAPAMPHDGRTMAETMEQVESYLAEQAPTAGAGVGITPVPIPKVPPIGLPFRAASGRYRSPAAPFQLELRVDIDGARPLMKLSGDYYSVSGGTTTYFGSWTVDAVTVTRHGNEIIAVGTARTT